MTEYSEEPLEISNSQVEWVDALCKTLRGIIQTSVDVNKMVTVNIYGLEIRDGHCVTGSCGRGYTYAEACKDYYNDLKANRNNLEYNGERVQI